MFEKQYVCVIRFNRPIVMGYAEFGNPKHGIVDVDVKDATINHKMFDDMAEMKAVVVKHDIARPKDVTWHVDSKILIIDDILHDRTIHYAFPGPDVLSWWIEEKEIESDEPATE